MYMKRKLNIYRLFTALTALLLLAGCHEETAGTKTTPPIGPDGTYRGQISIELPAATMEPTANATGTQTVNSTIRSRTAGDIVVTDIWILQFDMSSATDGTDGALKRAEYTTQISAVGKRLFMDVQLFPGDNMKVMLVANTHNTALFDTTNPMGNTLTPEGVMDKIFTIHATKGTGVPDDDKGLLMAGSTETITLAATADPLSITLEHTVAKIGVFYDLSELPDGVSFTNVKMQLRCVPKEVRLTPPTLPTTPYPTGAADSFTDYTSVTFSDNTTGQAVWYMAPNLRGTGSATDPWEKTNRTAPNGQGEYCTYVELSGDYQASPTASPTEVFYRLWLGENNISDYNIAAGKLYKVNIIPINASRFDSRITTYLYGFDLSEDESDGDHDGNILWGTVDYTSKPANCYVTQPGRAFKFDATKKPRSVVTNAVAHQGYLNGTESGTENYYTWGVYPSTGVPEHLKNQPLTTDLQPDDIDRIEVVWQTAVEHGVGFNDSATPGSTSVDFTTLTLNNKSFVKAFINTISYDPVTGHATVLVNGTGNALIAAYSAENTILWSWHIWGTDSEPQANIDTSDESVNGTGKKFMDRNLGALSAIATKPTEAEAYKCYGMMYQWGRKEPFTGAGPQYTVNPNKSDKNSISAAIFDKQGKWIRTSGDTSVRPVKGSKGGYNYSGSAAASTYILLTNPTTHYCPYKNGGPCSGNPSTWVPYSDGTPKSIYDPCPYGYRVPKTGSWEEDASSYWTQYAINGGAIWHNTWWPAVGYRYNNDAILANVGNTVYCWSSSSIVENQPVWALSFFFTCSNYAKSGTDARSNGFSVRCVEE